MKGFDLQSNRLRKGNFEKLDTVVSKEDSDYFGRDSVQKHENLKEFYEMRINELSKTVASTVAALTEDQLLSTMLEEPTSRPFARHRVKEIIEECLDNDRETLIRQLSEQLSVIEVDYGDLEQEYSRVYQEQKENIHELEERIQEMQKQHDSDVKEREAIIGRMNSLKQNTEELTEKYENRLKSKEKEAILRDDRQRDEAHIMTNKIKDFEKINTELKNELDEQIIKRRELQEKFQVSERQLSETNEMLVRYESSQKRLNEDIMKLNEENSRLREKLVHYEEGKKAFEDGFRQRIKEIEKGIEDEKESHGQHIESLQNKYEEKMEKFKEKITSYKNRLAEKENELEVTIIKHKETERNLNKNITALENKLEDQKVNFEKTLSQVEEENHRFIHEQREHYEKNLQNLEKRFEDVFDRKLHQLQSEAETQIENLKHDKDKLQRLLDEKQLLIEREYIKLSYHEELLHDRNNVIKRLEQDSLDREYEADCRLKDLENKLQSEFHLKKLEFQRVISGLEVQISDLRAQKNLLENEKLSLLRDSELVKDQLQECSNHNARLIDNVEQWTSKAEKLNFVCDEERNRGAEFEQKMLEYRERCQELKKAYEALVEEGLEKDIQTRKLTDQISALEKELKQRGVESKSLTLKSHSFEEEIYKLREQLEDSKKQERFNDLRAFESEEKLKRIALEVEEAQREKSKLNTNCEALKKQKHDIKAKLAKVTEICKRITKEKQTSEKDLERATLKINRMQNSINKTILGKVAIFKNELNEMRDHYKVTTSRMTKENEAKIVELTKYFMGILVEAREQKAQQLQKDFNYQYDGLKEKSQRMERDMEEMYEQKYLEKERNVKYLQDINNKLNENIKGLKEDYERLQMKYSRSIDDAEKIAREKRDAESRLDQLRQQYVSEINSFNYELQKCSQEFMSQKIILQDERATELKNVLNEVEKLKHINQETLARYEGQVQQLSTRYSKEIESLERTYKAEAQEVTRMLTESRLVEQELAIKMLDLNETVYKFESRNYELEKENVALKHKEDEYLGLYESKIEELKTMITKDNERMNAFKTEKFRELSNYKSAMVTFENEVALKDKKIEDLSEERELLKRRMQELVTQNDLLESQRSKENSKFRSKTLENLGDMNVFVSTGGGVGTRKYEENELSKRATRNFVKPNSTAALTLNNSRLTKKDVESSILASTRKSQYKNPLGTAQITNHLTLDDFDS